MCACPHTTPLITSWWRYSSQTCEDYEEERVKISPVKRLQVLASYPAACPLLIHAPAFGFYPSPTSLSLSPTGKQSLIFSNFYSRGKGLENSFRVGSFLTGLPHGPASPQCKSSHCFAETSKRSKGMYEDPKYVSDTKNHMRGGNGGCQLYHH